MRKIDAQNPRSGEWLQNDRVHKEAVISSDHRSFLAGCLDRNESYQSVMHGRGIGLLSSKFSEERVPASQWAFSRLVLRALGRGQ